MKQQLLMSQRKTQFSKETEIACLLLKNNMPFAIAKKRYGIYCCIAIKKLPRMINYNEIFEEV